ncbi:C1 family peptidase [Flavobacterium amniphilum]|uniref:C1 family peptidase n=1 Tax=Flavobacterium amniphilum TaxID=1834035 RepID=UPI00202A9772|nr:C1 family peptidase [Flavobacterium amniphilum]MCL9807375.1 C1 family peptidase [Flavobacterium amniphilum]
MKPTNLKSWAKKLGVLLLGVFTLAACENDKKESGQEQEKLMDGHVNLLDKGRYGCEPFSEQYLKSIKVITPEEYQARISEFRPDLSAAEQRNAFTAKLDVSKYLPSPPVGDQGSEGSCVGWGVGYAAHGITRYINNTIHQSNWAGATRSAAYVYNQIKISNCGSGSYPNDAMNLIKNQGQCSNSQMPYVAGGCYTQPTTQQRTWASGRKTGGWFNISTTNVNDIKYYLSQNYPVAACFDVNQSFYDMRNNNHVWANLYGARQGGHCVCIVGYDDNTRQFKVLNSWGANWGRSGYFYVTYDNMARGAFNWLGCITPNPNANSPQQ